MTKKNLYELRSLIKTFLDEGHMEEKFPELASRARDLDISVYMLNQIIRSTVNRFDCRIINNEGISRKKDDFEPGKKKRKSGNGRKAIPESVNKNQYKKTFVVESSNHDRATLKVKDNSNLSGLENAASRITGEHTKKPEGGKTEPIISSWYSSIDFWLYFMIGLTVFMSLLLIFKFF